MRIQNAIDVSASDPDRYRPEPDAAVTVLPHREYSDRHPRPDDLVLVASDSTHAFDRIIWDAHYAPDFTCNY